MRTAQSEKHQNKRSEIKLQIPRNIKSEHKPDMKENVKKEKLPQKNKKTSRKSNSATKNIVRVMNTRAVFLLRYSGSCRMILAGDFVVVSEREVLFVFSEEDGVTYVCLR